MISVIINTRNEEKNITRCLRSLESQTQKDFETIVVDNNSDDKTQDLARELKAEVYDLGPERSEQKNFGAQKSRGEYLLFVDADMELTEGVLTSCLQEIHRGFDALVVPEISVGEGFWAQCRSLEKRLYFNDPEIEAPRFFRRAVFEKVGGYSTGMVAGEDWDLREKVKKNNGRVGRIEDLIYHHEGRIVLLSDLKKKFYYGSKSEAFLSKNRPDLFRFLIRPAHWNKAKYYLTDPIHFLGMLFMKSLEFGAGFIGIIYAKFL